MKKSKKLLTISALGILLSISSVVGASATTINFTNNEVPKYQGYGQILAAKKSENSSYGVLKVTDMTGASAVTFSAASVSSLNYGTGVVIEKKDLKLDRALNYVEEYVAGTPMTVRMRNHSWSMNRAFVSGSMNYK